MISFEVSSLKPSDVQKILQSVVAPRPICFASTIDAGGRINLSPFSFFNLFSIQPPICVFSPSRRMRDNSVKHTLENVQDVPECVINMVDYSMVGQTSLASCDFPKGVNEFEKTGLTMVPSDMVKPPRVAESPVQLECRVRQIIALGDGAGAGNLVIAEVVKIHLADKLLGHDGQVIQSALDLVARLGGNWYARITPGSLFEWEKPNVAVGMGFDKLPYVVQSADWLTENEKSMFANLSDPPDRSLAFSMLSLEMQSMVIQRTGSWESRLKDDVIRFLRQGMVLEAWCLVIQLD